MNAVKKGWNTMKRTSVKLKLKQRLELVRTTVRELNQAELGTVNGGYEYASTACPTKCCDFFSYIPPP